ncbi:amidase family protein [Streptomyces sp. NPDC101160]|uniref:amidase family protein n=1 Tax=Streptomyces sp. NPDC101160 TaxID=3366118 RepID=UPI003811255A
MSEAIGTVFGAAMAWIVGYWTRELGREPRPGELEPYTRACWEHGRRVTGGDYLLSDTTLQSFARTVARFLTRYDAVLTPTLAQPPLPLGEMTSSDADPWRTARNSAPFIAFPAVVANITGAPAMSVPLHWSPAGLPVGVHFLGRPGAEATLFRLAGQLERARPWSGRAPAPPSSVGRA